jgi:lipoprotein signal peptidase
VNTLYLAVAISYVAVGLVMAVLYVYVFRRRFTGHFWAAALVAICGAFIGGLIDFLFADIIEQLTSIVGVLNLFPPLIAAAVVLSTFASLSERKDEYDD